MEKLKAEVYRLCLNFIRQRISTAEIALQQSREASNDDTKSSAGDKFETTREMMQQDITRNKNLLLDGQQHLQLLTGLEHLPSAHDTVRNGSLVTTSRGMFYIAVSAGQIQATGQSVFAISAVSPIGKLLIGRKPGDQFSFNQLGYTVLQID